MNNPVCAALYWEQHGVRSITLPQTIIVNLLAQMKVSRPRLHMTQLIVIITFINV